MNSKEALLKIESFCAYYDELNEALRVIAKVVEVLEILKPRIILKDSTLDVMEVAFIEARGFVFKNSNEYRLLKEWLNDNKK